MATAIVTRNERRLAKNAAKAAKKSNKVAKSAKAVKEPKLALGDAIATVKGGTFNNGMKAAIDRVLHFAILIHERRETRAAKRR